MSIPVYQEAWITGPQNTKFFTRRYGPPTGIPTKAIIVFAHGFIEHIARYEHVFPLYAARNIAVFAFDQRGFGQTSLHQDKSDHSSYAKTSWLEQMADIDFFLGREMEMRAKGIEGTAKVFLMGHSMGGGEALGYASTVDRKVATNMKHLAGVIATSPLLRQATPAPKLKRAIGGLVSKLAPSAPVPTPVDPKALSHDPQVGEDYIKDPLVKHAGTLKGVSDMLNQGELTADEGAKKWPAELPVLLIHGTEDAVTSYPATEKFFKDVTAKDKTFTPFTGGYHELHNEPDGVKEKVTDAVIVWIEQHLGATNEAPKL